MRTRRGFSSGAAHARQRHGAQDLRACGDVCGQLRLDTHYECVSHLPAVNFRRSQNGHRGGGITEKRRLRLAAVLLRCAELSEGIHNMQQRAVPHRRPAALVQRAVVRDTRDQRVVRRRQDARRVRVAARTVRALEEVVGKERRVLPHRHAHVVHGHERRVEGKALRTGGLERLLRAAQLHRVYARRHLRHGVQRRDETLPFEAQQIPREPEQKHHSYNVKDVVKYQRHPGGARRVRVVRRQRVCDVSRHQNHDGHCRYKGDEPEVAHNLHLNANGHDDRHRQNRCRRNVSECRDNAHGHEAQYRVAAPARLDDDEAFTVGTERSRVPRHGRPPRAECDRAPFFLGLAEKHVRQRDPRIAQCHANGNDGWDGRGLHRESQVERPDEVQCEG
eukprot:PhM_4_TR5361/c1_g1_i1/m.29103